MVWKFCEIWKSYGNRLSEGSNSVRFFLTVWGMACMGLPSKYQYKQKIVHRYQTLSANSYKDRDAVIPY